MADIYAIWYAAQIGEGETMQDGLLRVANMLTNDKPVPAEPVAWVDSLDRPAPHCVTSLRYCSVADHDSGRHLKYTPLYTHPPAPQAPPDLPDDMDAAARIERLTAAPALAVLPEMTREQIRDLVKECGLDWHRGFMPLFDDDDTNRYEVLVRAALAAAQPAPVPTFAEPEYWLVVSKDEQGQIVAVTRQDEEGRILSVIAESDFAPAAPVPVPPGWMPIETAPRDGRKILLSKHGWWNDTGDAEQGSDEWKQRIWDKTRRKYGLWWCVSGNWSARWNNWNDGVEPSGLAGPTHWMPLPPPPGIAAAGDKP